MGIPEHLTCFLRFMICIQLYVNQEATVRTAQEKMHWLQFGKTGPRGRVLSACLRDLYAVRFMWNLYAVRFMWNARLDESQARTKTARRNIKSLCYANDTTLLAESEGELKNLWMRVRENEKAHLKDSIQKMKTMASGSITPWQIERRTCGSSDRFYLHGLQNHCRWWLQPWI